MWYKSVSVCVPDFQTCSQYVRWIEYCSEVNDDTTVAVVVMRMLVDASTERV